MAKLVTCLALLTFAVRANAHAYLNKPGGRQILNPREYSPAGANGRNPAPGCVCGDNGNQPTQNTFGLRELYGRPAYNTLVAGGIADIEVFLQHSHKGRLEFRICEYSGAETASTLNQECLDKNILQPAPGTKTMDRVIPPDPWWWLGDYVWEGTSAIINVQYLVPKGLTCNGITKFCVLQMTYITGNSCNPPGNCPTTSPATCYPPTWNPVCRLDTNEAFRNCADVVVTKVNIPNSPPPPPSPPYPPFSPPPKSPPPSKPPPKSPPPSKIPRPPPPKSPPPARSPPPSPPPPTGICYSCSQLKFYCDQICPAVP